MLVWASGCCRPGAAERPYTAAELEAEERVQLERAGAGYTSAVVAPFVVIGDGPASAVRNDAAETVAWARDLLERDYFARAPGAIISIWVFRDEPSYRSGVSALFGSLFRPDTPYGYYSPCERALVTNVGYGYGTLVHEMVHAYMSANFSDAPVWFDEGLASLYEQPSCRARTGEDSDDLACARNGHIRGGVNWRLPGLQDALRRGRAPSFERIGGAGRMAFNGRERGELYAVSRYLLYWLQEKEVLVRYFHAFRGRVGADASGMRTLAEILGRPLPELRREWEGFVSGLTFARVTPRGVSSTP